MAFLEKSHPLWQTLSGVVEDEGFVLYDAELLTPGSLRLSIARKEAEQGGGGVTSGDCSRVLRRLMVLFQAEGRSLGVSSEPEIDVSSPGLNRALRLVEHYERALGERVKVILQPSKELETTVGKKTATLVGLLERVADGRVSVRDEASSQSFDVPLSDIKRANVEFVF